MGLSFHYKGKLAKAANLPQLIDEVEDICNILSWKFVIFEQNFPNNEFDINSNEDYGIMFTPPNCESISLAFDGSGRLFTPWMREISKNKGDGQIKIITVKIDLNQDEIKPEINESSTDFNTEELMYNHSVKTSNAGAETHIKVIELLKYLSSKYLEDFELNDESDFWNTGDVALLNQKMEEMNHLISFISNIFEHESIKSVKDLMKTLKKFRKDLENRNFGKMGEDDPI